MSTWQQFENSCFDYLNKKYNDKCKIIAMGKSDSTHPDIFLETAKASFYIEVKEANAQSGQFVLLPDVNNQKFIFSSRNKTLPNEFTEIITDYMNNGFERFNAAGTTGQNLDIDENIFSDWIVNYYISKGVKYFITKSADYIIFPVSNFKNYFTITSKYRIKRSGSSEPSAKYQNSVINTLENIYGITDYRIIGKKLFVSGNSTLNKVRFIMGDYEYYLAQKDDGKYEVRQLSNTYNMNVIFSISLKANQNPKDLAEFENEF